MKKKYPKKYIPSTLSKKNANIIKKEINKSQKLYKKGKYHIRKTVKTKTKQSKHVLNAKRIYKMKTIKINNELSKKTGCSKNALLKIMKKGQGAYFTGSRPNQTPHSWGIARLSSAITGGKSSAVDFNELKSGCKKNSKALRLAIQSKKKHGKGTRKVPKRLI
mgnify:CR=1 FL=1|tara:strand:+ start:2425 stop:2913 length:489 start_codon:yes stop_codon:yes gene_type:complete